MLLIVDLYSLIAYVAVTVTGVIVFGFVSSVIGTPSGTF